MDGAVVERKVPLPSRWLRGFAEVQVISSASTRGWSCPPRRADRVPAPAAGGRGDRSVLWAVPAGRSLRLTSRPVPGAVCLPGSGPAGRCGRCCVSPDPPGVRAGGHGRATAAPSTWELEPPTLRLTLTLSPEPSRGFSGEGAVLEALAGDDVDDDAELVSALLAWDPTIDVDALAGRPRCRRPGPGGADPAGHRRSGRLRRDRGGVLPPGAALRRGGGRAEEPAPGRCAPAGGTGAVETCAAGSDHAWVRSGHERYQCGWPSGRPVSCTCTWWGRHRGDRGPCKHVLAVDMTLAPAATTEEEAWETAR